MSTSDDAWRNAAREFFGSRSRGVRDLDSLEALCFVSGRDSRIWANEQTYAEMIDSILENAGAASTSRLLEVGCAAGFLAWGLAPRVAEYFGIDLSPDAVERARSLRLPGARFEAADGSSLPLEADSFDCVTAYDVFTNFPDFEVVAPVLREMVRVVRPGGRVLAGSIPDSAFEAETFAMAAEIGERLSSQGAAWHPDVALAGWRRLLPRRWQRRHQDRGQIVCYFFERGDFEALARELGATIEFTAVHPRHPYATYRFNAVLTKSGR